MGAGLLSAPDEMEYAMSDQPMKPKFDPGLLAKVQFDDTTLQSSYAVLDVSRDVVLTLKPANKSEHVRSDETASRVLRQLEQ